MENKKITLSYISNDVTERLKKDSELAPKPKSRLLSQPLFIKDLQK